MVAAGAMALRFVIRNNSTLNDDISVPADVKNKTILTEGKKERHTAITVRDLMWIGHKLTG